MLLPIKHLFHSRNCCWLLWWLSPPFCCVSVCLHGERKKQNKKKPCRSDERFRAEHNLRLESFHPQRMTGSRGSDFFLLSVRKGRVREGGSVCPFGLCLHMESKCAHISARVWSLLCEQHSPDLPDVVVINSGMHILLFLTNGLIDNLSDTVSIPITCLTRDKLTHWLDFWNEFNFKPSIKLDSQSLGCYSGGFTR